MTTLRDAVRAAATERTWSQGVTLARDGRVTGRTQRGDELDLEVRVPGRPTPFEVVINSKHQEWECSCTSREPVCSHVVASVIAAEQSAGTLPTSNLVTAQMRYVLKPETTGLSVERWLVRPDKAELFKGSLLSLVGTGKANHIATLEADLTADKVIGARAGVITGERLDRLLAVLAGARDVRLGDEPVTTSGDPVMPRAVIEDARGGVSVRIEADRGVREVVALGVVLTSDNTLRPVGAVDLTGARLEKLPQSFTVARSAFPELMARTIPALAARIDVDIRAQNLPKIGNREQPRMAFEVEQDGDRLLVMPTLVYGDPPRARIDGSTLVHLQGTLPMRDQDAERRLTHRLRDELNLVPGRRVELAGRDAFTMHNALAGWLRSDARAASVGRALVLDARIAIDGSSFDVELTGSNGRTASPIAALRAWQAGIDMVPLVGGGWGRVPMSWFDKHGHRVADLLAARGDDKKLPIYALPDLARLSEELDEPPPPELDRLKPLLDKFAGIPHAPAAAGFVGELRPYQQSGVDWLVFCREAGLGCVLADDMGLGKTIQALAAVRAHGTQRTLVVSPTSVLFNWLAELRKFRPDLHVATYHGARRVLDPTADVVLTSYPILRNDTDVLAQQAWDTVILDESQTIKNPDSQVARAAYKLKAGWRVTLSGTPIENRLDELWSQLHFTNPGLLGGRTDFADRWAAPIGDGDAGAAARLRERIRPFVLRRRKSEGARELPPRTDSVMYVVLDASERVTYDAIRAATQREIVAMLEAGRGVMAALEALLRLRQAACHTALLPAALRGTPMNVTKRAAAAAAAAAQAEADAEAALSRDDAPEDRPVLVPAGATITAPAAPVGPPPLGSSKVTRLLLALEDAVADGHRALVFSQWTSLLDLIEPHLDRAGIKFVRLDGTTVDRGRVVNTFQAEDGPPVMLLSLKAGGTGLNLTAADHVFLVDPWWNPAVEDQAADRAHRIGQDKPVMVYRMVARDTVEERILELQSRKRALADAALADAGGAAAITRDDLLALLA